MTLNDSLTTLVWTQLWQVTLVAAGIALIVRLTCRRKPHLAYILWMVVLIKAITPPLWSSPTSVFSWTLPGSAVSQLVAAPQSDSRPLESIGSTGATATLMPDDAVHSVSAAAKSAPHEQTTAELSAPTDLTNNIQAQAVPAAATRWQTLVTWLCAVWALGAIVYAAGTLLSILGCWRVIQRSRVPVDRALLDRLEALSARLGIRQHVRLVVVDSPAGPLTFGWLRPTVVIPRVIVERQTSDQLEPILAHELIHVRRGDSLVGLVQVLAQGLWWFHPLIWLSNRRMCQDRERCCDEEVVAGLAYHPRQYGLSLLGVLELKQQMRLPTALPGIRAVEVTRRRIEHLVSASQSFRTRMPRRYWLVLLVALACCLPGAGLSRVEPRGLQAAPPTKQSEQPAAPKKEAPQPADSQAAADNAGWTVTGRVIDHRGAPVPNAEVVLLGNERIIADAGERRHWFVLGTGKDRPPNPNSVRTNQKGEFTISRNDGSPDRIAIMAQDPLFWEVARTQITDSDHAEIKLPASGSLTVACDLPGKPAEQPINIELRTFDGVRWNGDMLRFHFGSESIKNPGETIFERLPPGRYSVERNQSTKTGERSSLITFADRQLVEVQSGQRAQVRIDRKVGRPLQGRVRGLENVELAHAHVTLSYSGPEEEPGKDGKPQRRMTAFDVIPIGSDGKFSTDPIPPGKYMVSAVAMLSTTSNQSPRQYDFESTVHITVPAEGEMPAIDIEAKPRRERGNSPRRSQNATNPLRVVDDQGKAVPRFEIMVLTADRGSSIWFNGSEGIVTQNQPLWGFDQSDALDVIVRAEGFASTIAHFTGPDRDKLLRGEASVTLDHGQEVSIRFQLPAGMSWPEGMKPELYFGETKDAIRRMWQPSNRKQYAEHGLPDMNTLSARQTAPGVTSLKLSERSAPFYVAIYAPGFLRFFERGPFTLADVKDVQLDIPVERPIALDVVFNPGSGAADQRPYSGANIDVLWKIPGQSTSYLSVIEPKPTEPVQNVPVTDLAAGDYLVMLQTTPKPNAEGKLATPTPGAIHPGAFFASQRVTLAAGKPARVELAYAPFDPQAFRGERTALVRVMKGDGSPAAGQEATITYHDGHYGNIDVISDKLSSAGEIRLAKITDRTVEGIKPYTVTVAGKRLGSFTLEGASEPAEFTFQQAPDVGDLAPDIEMVRVSSGNTTRLSELRGKLVCLEFWATWCGPCREPMQKLNRAVADQREAWKDQVVVAALSIDDSLDLVAPSIKARGWDQIEHFWSGAPQATQWDSAAARAFVVDRVPTAVLIDRDGRILWRGHPGAGPSGPGMAERIAAAIAK